MYWFSPHFTFCPVPGTIKLDSIVPNASHHLCDPVSRRTPYSRTPINGRPFFRNPSSSCRSGYAPTVPSHLSFTLLLSSGSLRVTRYERLRDSFMHHTETVPHLHGPSYRRVPLYRRSSSPKPLEREIPVSTRRISP